MAKRLAAGCLLLLAVLADVSAASVLKAGRALAQKKYAHLQADIDLWKRLGKPTQIAWPHDEHSIIEALLVDLPDSDSEKAGIFGNDIDDNTDFYLFTKENRNGSLVAPEVAAFRDAGWNPDRATKIVIHGFTNNIQSDIFQYLVPALLDNGDNQVIGVDWGKLAEAPFYIEARNRVDGVGKVVAKLVDKLVLYGGLDLRRLHILGHSLGAHVSGNVGKHITTGRIARITGMDPAMPLFLILKSDRLKKSDAEMVDVVHTCAGLLGLETDIGKVDFYPNGGSFPQPGCGSDLFGTCSHGRSYMYMAESASEPESFPAVECASASSASDGNCGSEKDGRMGLNLQYNPDGTGTYYLQTASAFPFDLQSHSRSQAEGDADP